MTRRRLLARACLAPWVAWAPAALPKVQSRHALVIGNARYTQAPLANPENDARLVAQTLRSLGFKVEARYNLHAADFRRTLRKFCDLMRAEDTALVLYYAGHGMQLDGRNYLLPVNLNLRDEREIRDEAIDLEQSLRAPADDPNYRQARIFIIDACRDNPFLASLNGPRGPKGLAQLELASALVAYSTSAGETVDDGPPGANSLFSRVLAEELPAAGLPVEAMFKRVQNRVREESGGKQRPLQYNGLLADFQFNPGPLANARPLPLIAQAPSAGGGTRELVLTLHADRNLNTDQRQAPASLALRLYLLRDSQAFDNASFDSLYDRDEATLGASLLWRQALHLRPGESRELALALPPGTQCLAVMAAYRELGQAQWRTSMAVPTHAVLQPLRLEALARQLVLRWAP